jgi:hypothetical protein
MFNYNIKAKGSLFKGMTKSTIQEAIRKTADWTQNKLKTESPVLTGKLKSGWTVTPNSSSFTVSNPVPYTPFIEKRVRLVAKTVPQVEKKLVENLKTATNKLK